MSDSTQLRKTLKEALSNGELAVTFKKVNGEERIMTCTLSSSIIPTDKQPKGEGRKENEEVLAVFDVNKQDWRSFRIDSIIEVEGLNV